ncbi:MULTISPECIES: ParB/RepB/Spo0J family partition protein [Pseudomonas]|uniref:Plasmid partitioning protein RepB C-terminal domain-containing protein n=1 Tax=Pseudomonas asiatica TaxID=2219225 RepID=A0ABU5L4G8_9PSED|nr:MULTISPECIES: plasmid partitioning protein RepB C-terminal domain-containing protein [Pseudomonas]MBF8757393.1 ParB N-terminal domain-containing protein [Pseudomonas guariconensis]MDZ5741045.1 plasmid partitioning protein RepB C-terminal domain-containing protein [Pseudomonas asiatica]MDZ5745946.1 plasmid partitioning protein RepB C-terminal domain-containing protein [Pseudomonas asiatica]MDZ5750500.1 plasmid partitioning protein RepB C-terminal domain-containing protein [Pseudomonas asiatic
MTVVKRAFEPDLITVRLQLILPSRQVTHDMLTSVKYAAILASIRELGVVEPLAVHPELVHGAGEEPRYLLLDGHLRLAALVQLGAKDALCLLATDDEGFTYNRQINRLTPIQEHKMILEAIRKGTTAERIAEVLSVNVGRIRERQRLLRGIAPEVAEMLKTRMVSQAVFRVLRKMKPMRQIELVEMMMSANCFTGRYAEMVLAATRPEQLVEAKKVSGGVTAEDIARMEREMEKLYHDYRLVEDTLGETMLVLVVAKGYVSRMLRNQTIAAYLERFEPDLVRELAGVVEAVTADARSLERE